MAPTVEETACLSCGEKTLTLHEVLKVNPPGTHSLAGVQLKLTATAQLTYRCGACGVSGPALLTDTPRRSR